MANSKPKNNQRADRGKNRKSGNVRLSAEEKKEVLAKQYGLKPKTVELLDNLDKYPTKTQAEVYMMNHKTENKITASNAVTKLLKKPSVIGYKDSAVRLAKNRVVSLVKSTNESIALKASQDIIDRNEGKSVQKTENLSRTVEVKLDLTGVRVGSHYINIGNGQELLES